MLDLVFSCAPSSWPPLVFWFLMCWEPSAVGSCGCSMGALPALGVVNFAAPKEEGTLAQGLSTVQRP